MKVTLTASEYNLLKKVLRADTTRVHLTEEEDKVAHNFLNRIQSRGLERPDDKTVK